MTRARRTAVSPDDARRRPRVQVTLDADLYAWGLAHAAALGVKFSCLIDDLLLRARGTMPPPKVETIAPDVLETLP